MLTDVPMSISPVLQYPWDTFFTSSCQVSKEIQHNITRSRKLYESWVQYLIMVAKMAKFHMLFHVVMIKIFFHPSNITPVQVPVTFTAVAYIQSVLSIKWQDKRRCIHYSADNNDHYFDKAALLYYRLSYNCSNDTEKSNTTEYTGWAIILSKLNWFTKFFH